MSCSVVTQIHGQETLNGFLDPGIPMPPLGKLAVCHKAMYGAFGDTMELSQFLLYYSAMGASHFTFFQNRGMAPAMVSPECPSALSLASEYIVCCSVAAPGSRGGERDGDLCRAPELELPLWGPAGPCQGEGPR
jgi:hypothetical protein